MSISQLSCFECVLGLKKRCQQGFGSTRHRFVRAQGGTKAFEDGRGRLLDLQVVQHQFMESIMVNMFGSCVSLKTAYNEDWVILRMPLSWTQVLAW